MSSVDVFADILTRRPLLALVAEDNMINQIVMSKLLEGVGHEVEVVENGQLACDILSERRFDFIVMDVHMPILNGLDATRAIREGGNMIPIIGCTADSFPDQLEIFRLSGMDDIVVKPVHRERLLMSINKVMNETIHVQRDGSLIEPVPDISFS